MRGPAVRSFVVAAGGTGGHVFPAEALAAELAARGERVVLMTDARSGALMEKGGTRFEGMDRFILPGAGLAGRGARRAAAGALALARGTLQARHLLATLNPAAVVGFGGYPSVPPILAARLLPAARRPVLVLHEQNAVLGRANRFLSRGADLLALVFEDTARIPAGVATEVVGNPVRPAIRALAGQGFLSPAAEAPFHLLVLGGSLGARVFADVVPEAIARLAPEHRARLRVTQQCRAEDLERTRDAYAASGVAAELAPFFPDVAALYRNAHLVISRAGASSVAELACAGRPAILVPLPGAIDDHQSANARAMAASGAAEVMLQAGNQSGNPDGFTPAALASALTARLEDPTRLIPAAAAAAGLARPDAAALLADRVQALAHSHTTR
ncbi:undecaprenyldiphospho-muramoylpentapeptide beta-N-acetylglucosaminyltransferase [Roseomonas mucosa]|uniref:UDP-N-acetylglucosamine--N-acetylmuramyl-(pentapeptide) pyrophosphoryl-undecaprenol N-acetylglucosamine transferase n=1 Tax=Roseomonas mucosa TaxID=207340 RepID=A0A1S8D1X4_9PROT|nr:undecaprenyldiphospho-muramoylpentapeptide beta-N-acetylglucosaminyltransferase [Roseomonas mucosa]ONH81979.1 undecaprenyldiphospho-muramoylpentapeptide beta-N-acetylglucosaminyltransferase [Roseomonas mucosa]